MEEQSSSLLQLTDWLHSVGIWWDQSLVQIRGGCSNCSGPALGVFAVSDVQENQLLCVIPRSAILSPRTTQLAQILEAEKLGGGLALTIAVMYEASLDKASKWAGYFASLPGREYLPMFWSQGELQLLAGTALEGLAEDDRRDTEEDYESHVVPLLAKHKQAFPHPELCSLQHFRVAASWVASRSFHVDSWHGDAMVPLADIFNHKASLVLLEDGWQVAEEIDRQQQQQHDADDAAAAADASDDDASADGEHHHGGSNDCSNDAGDDGSNGDSDDESDDEGDDDDVDDPQHGFAVGGMPMIAAAAAAAAGAAGPAGPAAGGIVHQAAGCWVRDGVNLRLEIGICSIGDPDTTLASMTGAAAAAEGKHGSSHHHEHDAHCGCSGHDEGADDDSAENKQQKRHAAPSDPTQQQRKKQKTEQQQQQDASAGQQDASTAQEQQQQIPDKRLEIVAAAPVAAGAEVHNTYGELSNQALVHKYGFCLRANPFDEVDLGPGWPWLLKEVAAAAGLSKQLKQHVAWLERNSHLLPAAGDAYADEDAESAGEATAEPPAVLPGGRLPSVVAAAVRLLGASAAQLKAWGSLQEALQDDEQQQQDSIQTNARPEDGAADAADGEAAAAEKALAEHFDDVQITSRSVDWWGRAGLQLLKAAVQQRIQRYPGQGLSIAADEAALQALQTKPQQQQGEEEKEGCDCDGKQLAEKTKTQKQQQEGCDAGSSAGEHAAAVAAALQLRICEQRILQQALDAIERVLG